VNVLEKKDAKSHGVGVALAEPSGVSTSKEPSRLSRG
jgi:hypothetical protein